MNIDGLPALVSRLTSSVTQGSRHRESVPQQGETRSAGAELTRQTRSSPTVRDVREGIEIIDRALRESRRNLTFSIDESTGKTVARVVHPDTGEVLRQIPSDEILAIAEMVANGEPITSVGLNRSS